MKRLRLSARGFARRRLARTIAGMDWIRLGIAAAAAIVVTGTFLGIAILAEDAFRSAISGILQGNSFLMTGINAGAMGILPGGILVVALIAGMLAAINPCGFAILPAYLSLFLNDGVEETRRAHVPRQMLRGLEVSGVIGLGFIVLFGTIGSLLALLSASRGFITGAFPWVGLSLGIIMVGLGAFVLMGGKIYSALPQRYASKIGGTQQLGLRGYFLFGISYALASLSCVLPLFLSIIVGSFTASGVLGVVLTFLTYAVGMTLVVGLLTLLVAAFKTGITRYLFKALPAINIISACLIMLVGVYLLLYWLVEGNLIDTFTGTAA